MNFKLRLVSPVIMWLIVLFGIGGVFWLVPARFVWPRNIATSALIFPAAIYWLYFFLGAIKVHRRAALSADKINKLVVDGVYSKVRHPIYSADIIFGWSLFFFYPDVRFLISAHWLMFTLLFWMRREETALTKKFGNEYLEYARCVPKLFPRLFD